MERRITRRQALGTAGSAGAALLVSRPALGFAGRARRGRSGPGGDGRGGGHGHPDDDRRPLLGRRDAATLRRPQQHGNRLGRGRSGAGRCAAAREDQRARRCERRTRSTAPTSTSGTRTPTGSIPTRAASRAHPPPRARTSCAASRSPVSTPGRSLRRSTVRSTSRRSGRAGTRVARSTSMSASAPTTAARSRPTTRPRSSSPTPTTTPCSPVRPRTTRRSPKTDPTTDETDNVLTSAAHATNVVPVDRDDRRRLRGDVHDRPVGGRLVHGPRHPGARREHRLGEGDEGREREPRRRRLGADEREARPSTRASSATAARSRRPPGSSPQAPTRCAWRSGRASAAGAATVKVVLAANAAATPGDPHRGR